MKTKRNQAFTLIELLVVITIIAILASLAVPAFNMVQTNGNQMKGVSNCKQIIMSLKQFSKDYNSQYPDSVANPQTGSMAQSANDAFRFLIQEQIVSDERIFGCPAGFNPDANIGQAPNFGNALLPGENHWAMTGNQTDATVGNMPIVFENPVAPNWPPLWNADVAGQVAPGRTWPGGKIIIGRNDGSAAVEALAGKKGMIGPKIMSGGFNLFTQASQGQPQRVLPVVLGNNYTQQGAIGNPGTGAPPGGLGGAPLNTNPGGLPGAPPPAPIGGAPAGGAPGGLPPSTLGN
jgi:prepilin-type N-terminal cleavage/methylation domain-containing protein